MKNLSFILLFISAISVGCQAKRDVKLFYLKIAPIGISDFPRDTLFISMTKLTEAITLRNTHRAHLVRTVLTDEKTLSKIVSFVIDNNKETENKDFREYGCFNITLYDRTLIVSDYYLHRAESREYLKALIDMLNKNKLDGNVMRELKQSLMPIDYVE